MILYNITFNIEPEIKDNWLAWIREEYIPYLKDTGTFTDIKIFCLLNEIENQGLTYSIQCFSESLTKVNTYLEIFAPKIVERHNQLFKYKHVSFMTILEQLD
ncbi:MAG: DUF4286 family protein [Cytophagales bacterium]|nr:DUF4286 family protein [Cytophagales bacterium]